MHPMEPKSSAVIEGPFLANHDPGLDDFYRSVFGWIPDDGRGAYLLPSVSGMTAAASGDGSEWVDGSRPVRGWVPVIRLGDSGTDSKVEGIAGRVHTGGHRLIQDALGPAS